MHRIISTLFFFFWASFLFAQVKNIPAQRLTETISIDGQLNEPAWLSATIATGFIQEAPNPGVNADQETIVRVLYDNKAIYIGAHLKDASPDSILNQLTERDRIGITDWFAVIIDAYQDGQNGVGFAVTPSGVQVDQKYSLVDGGGGSSGSVFGGDQNWDAVWKSKTRIVEDGWIVEMSIPYSAIRFPNKKEQVWNINFGRMVRRLRQSSFWNPVKPQIEGLLNQSGTISNISNIKSPVRLSATPFLVSYLELFRDQNAEPVNTWGRAINGGMDVKYGINDAFTVDMTLIPDFGQTRSDNQVLNLSPFEVQFDENRPFFTEGTELFNKGGLFYSRRVGGRPLRFFDVDNELLDGDSITSNPQDSRLYNATKLSGRTTNGLGIGLFNATSAPAFAKVKNNVTGETRDVETNPLTNYNVIVLDQNLKNNSSATLINTNVLRSGHAYDANVTGGLFNLRDKENKYEVSSYGFLSQKYFNRGDTYLYEDSIGLGYSYGFGAAKTAGQLQYGLDYSVDSRHYDNNDLGFLRQPNLKELSGDVSYNIFKPFGIFNRMRMNVNSTYRRLQDPNVFADFNIGVDFFTMTRKFFAMGLWSYHEPVTTRDYYEPRTDDFSLFYEYPTSNGFGAWVSSDYRKKFAYDIRTGFRFFDDANRYNINFSISPRFRLNDRLSFILDFSSFTQKDDVGYVATEDEIVVMGRRDVMTFENVLNTRYIFNNKMSLVFRLRHYWSVAEYSSFSNLSTDGTLSPSAYSEFKDNSFNAFNIDMEYRWRFAPGSDIFIVWKNAIAEFANEQRIIQYDYNNSLSRLSNIPQSNSFSVKIIYYLDYLSLRKEE